MIFEEPRPTKDLRGHWEYIQLRMAASPRCCILTDFDGTLVPLEAHPDLPRLEGEQRRLLEALRGNGRTVVGIVSGRALSDLIPRIGIQGIWYVGNHGYEIRSPNGADRRFYEPQDIEFLASIRDEMNEELRGIPGVFLEHKGPVLALHYRNVEESRTSAVEQAFIKVMDRHRLRLMISRGHAVLEARIRSAANKGRAVSHIRHELPAGTLVFYFGDDQTDRDAFRELKGTGVTVEVGGGETSLADFTLPDTKAVLETLSRIRTELGSTKYARDRERRPPSRKP